MRLTRPGADQTPSGSPPSSAKTRANRSRTRFAPSSSDQDSSHSGVLMAGQLLRGGGRGECGDKHGGRSRRTIAGEAPGGGYRASAGDGAEVQPQAGEP